MIPVLYKPTAQDFENNGEGLMTDAVSCQVTEELNGAYELTMSYPVGGQHYEQLEVDGILKAKPNDLGNPQLFRIYSITRPINQIVTINAEHISYELNKYPVLYFSESGSAIVALNTLLNASVVPHDFTAVSNVETVGETNILEPCSVRSCLGGKEGSILDVWGGEYEFDNYKIILHKARGRKTDVVLEYGKNLTDLSQEKNIGETYTAVMPYVKKTNGDTEEYIYLPEKYITASTAGNFARLKIAIVDFSQAFQDGETVTIQKLREKTEEYIKTSGIGIPPVNIKVAFAPLWQSPEYKHLQLLERVNLGDTLTVRFPKLGVDATAKVIKTVYDSLKERYISLELGDAKSNLADTVNTLQWQATKTEKQVQSVPNIINQKIQHNSSLITGNKGGHIVIKLDADGKPQEFLIMDTDNIATAKKVWRWNLSGLGYSDKGFNGPFDKIAITMEGEINAQCLSAFEIIGAQITSGRIESADKSVYFDLDTGVIKATEISSKSGDTRALIGNTKYGDAFKVELFGETALWIWRDPINNSVGIECPIYGVEIVRGLTLRKNETELSGENIMMRGERVTLNSDIVEFSGDIVINSKRAYTGFVEVKDQSGKDLTLRFEKGILMDYA